MKMQTLLAIVATGLLLVGQAEAQDSSAGEALYKKSCRNCHGPTGKGMASFPKLVGKSVDEIVSRLEAYRAGERVGPNSALMIPVAAKLTDQDIANLAEYITDELN
jgi:cytochrome c553